MQYLMIENPGQASTDLMTIVGASSSRHNEDMIGCFGSGYKYSTALLLRESLDLRLYVGKDGFTFEVDERKTKDVADRDFNIREVVMRQVAGSSRRRKPMGFDISFGAIDWTDPGMAVREFISNAADACIALGKPIKNMRVELVDEVQVRAKDGFTRVFIQADTRIREYHERIDRHFLIFRPGFRAENASLIPKRTNGNSVAIYRKGVLVGEFEYGSLFDYNLNDIELKESRVISESNARDACGSAIKKADAPYLVEFLQAVRDRLDLWETKHAGKFEMKQYDWERGYESYQEYRNNWTAAINEVFGDTGILSDNLFFDDSIRRKGFNPIQVDTDMMNVLVSWGARQAKDVLDHFEVNGRTKIDLTPDQENAARDVWEAMVEIGVTQDKDMPPIDGFHDVMTAGCTTGGYFDPKSGRVGISKDVLDTGLGFEFYKVLIEEFAHYVTQSRDQTRDLQDYAFRLAAKLMQKSLCLI